MGVFIILTLIIIPQCMCTSNHHTLHFRNTQECCECSALSHVWLFAIPCTVARQPPLSMGFSRQEYWSGLPCPPPGDLPNSGIEPRSQHCRQILHHLSHQGSLWILEWVAYPFSRGSSRPRNQTRVSCVAGSFLTHWAMREALKYIFIKYIYYY